MKITRKSELIIERSVTIRFGGAAAEQRSERFCRECASDEQFVTVDEAAILRGTTSRRIFYSIEAEQIHSLETVDGLLVVCLASLASVINLFNETPIQKQGVQTNDSINL